MRNPDDLHVGSKPAPGDLAFVQGFVNTTDLETGRDDFGTREGLAQWMQRHGLLHEGAEVSEAERRMAIEFREAVRSLIGANNGHPLDAEAVATLQSFSKSVPLHIHYREDGGLELHAESGRVASGLGELQAAIYNAMIEGTWPRLKACLSDSCQFAFFDASKNRSGTWCSMEVCGNRSKVRSHRQRKR